MFSVLTIFLVGKKRVISAALNDLTITAFALAEEKMFIFKVDFDFTLYLCRGKLINHGR